jgi:hypothetical protein
LVHLPASFWSDIAKGIPTALVTLALGMVGLLIAYNQLKVARTKLELDRYDKRYALFQKTWDILSATVMKGTREKNYGLATPFNNFLPEASFLFGQDIADYLSECSRNWTELYGLEAELNDVAAKDRQKNIERTSELRQWFFEQASVHCKATFTKYLKTL